MTPVLGIRKRHAIAATMPRGVPTRWTPDELYLAGGCPARVSPRASRRS
jgi:hypothetical protein